MARDSASRERGGQRERERERERERDRRTKQRRRQSTRPTDGNGEPRAKHQSEHATRITPHTSRPAEAHHSRQSRSESSHNTEGSSNPLSAGSLARLDALNQKLGWTEYDNVHVRARDSDERELLWEQRRHADARASPREKARPRAHGESSRRRRTRDQVDLQREENRRRRRKSAEEYHPHRKKQRVISGPLLEEGGKEAHEYRTRRGKGFEDAEYDDRARRRRKRLWIILGIIALVLAIAIPVGVLVGNRNSGSADDDSDGSSSDSLKPENANLDSISESDIPAEARGGLLDPFTWYDTTDFNVTYTAATVGGLSVMGLNSAWDDDVQANENVPPLKDPFDYGKMPYRGVNLGGWLNIEPFITPSFFSDFSTQDKVIDEYTLCSKLGPTKAAQALEQHYSSFVTAETFAEIRAAGLDHVRIPFGYWAVTTYEGDPYVPKIAWRYLLRGIEWARQNGLRIKLDLHGAPGSQNGWNHSGRQGSPGWLAGPEGDLNGQRTLEIHEQLSLFFAQARYKNVVTLYGLVNEPKMTEIDTERVLEWTKSAVSLIRENGIDALLVFGDGFMGLDKWQGQLQGIDDLVLDVHQYVIFNVDQIQLSHSKKLNFACGGWTAQMERSQNRQTGFGPTMCGEWSQADTDCARYLNNVGVGSRWEGTYNTGDRGSAVLTPLCPTRNSPRCSCDEANADASSYSDAYKRWLLLFALAQMESFEHGWGWFYWTWDTEDAVQWSYKKGLAAGILPEKPYERSWKCSDGIPDFEEMGLPEYY